MIGIRRACLLLPSLIALSLGSFITGNEKAQQQWDWSVGSGSSKQASEPSARGIPQARRECVRSREQ
jgi:hypothetical protein